MRSDFVAFLRLLSRHKVIEFHKVQQRRAVHFHALFVLSISEPGESDTRKPGCRVLRVTSWHLVASTELIDLLHYMFALFCSPVSQYRQPFAYRGRQILFQNGLPHLVQLGTPEID